MLAAKTVDSMAAILFGVSIRMDVDALRAHGSADAAHVADAADFRLDVTRPNEVHARVCGA